MMVEIKVLTCDVGTLVFVIGETHQVPKIMRIDKALGVVF